MQRREDEEEFFLVINFKIWIRNKKQSRMRWRPWPRPSWFEDWEWSSSQHPSNDSCENFSTSSILLPFRWSDGEEEPDTVRKCRTENVITSGILTLRLFLHQALQGQMSQPRQGQGGRLQEEKGGGVNGKLLLSICHHNINNLYCKHCSCSNTKPYWMLLNQLINLWMLFQFTISYSY